MDERMNDWLAVWMSKRRTNWVTDWMTDELLQAQQCKKRNDDAAASARSLVPINALGAPTNYATCDAVEARNGNGNENQKWKAAEPKAFSVCCWWLHLGVCVCVFGGGGLAWIVAVITNHKQHVAENATTTMQHRLKEENGKHAWVRACLGPLLQFTVGCSCGLPAPATAAAVAAWAQLQQKVQGQHWNNPDFAMWQTEKATQLPRARQETASLRAR